MTDVNSKYDDENDTNEFKVANFLRHIIGN